MPPPPLAVRRHRQGTRGPPTPPPLPAPPPAEEPRARPSDAVGGAAAGPAPASQHWRAGATRTTEQYGGRAPHDPPLTTAHSGRAEGGFRSAKAPGGAVRGPPLTPPPRGSTSAPTACTRRRERAGDTKGARIEYRRPPPRRGAGRPRRDTPPPAPPPARGPLGPRPRPPGAGGMVPPRPREEPERDPPPRPSRRPPWGPRRTSEPAPTRQDAAQIIPREAW